MSKMSWKEKREMIASAMKTISQQEGLSPEAKARGLEVLQKAFIEKRDAK